MINVAITEVKYILHVSCYGHAGIRGQSLQCAGASTLFAALAKSIQDKCEYVCESGYGYIAYPATSFNKALTHMFRSGMELLQEQYPDDFCIR